MAEQDATIFMCRPTHFGVQYVINPWMEGHVGRASNAAARRQWDELHATLATLTRVAVVEPAPALPDMCFIANAGLILGGRFVPAIFRFPQRQPEVPHYTRAMQDAGFETADLAGDDTFEGEGDALFAPEPPAGEAAWVWAGYGVRSALEAHRHLTDALNVEVVSLRLVDERFYHLDTCFYPLPGGRAVYHAGAFDDASLAEIRRRIPPEKRIEIAQQDAMRFACNAVRIGDTLVCNHASAELRSRLARWGYTVRTVSVEEFMLAGGAVKCLCLIAKQDVPAETGQGPRVHSAVAMTSVQVQGHLLDTGMMNRMFDQITDNGGAFHVEHFSVGQRRDQPSIARVRVAAPTAERLDLIANQLQTLGAVQIARDVDARTESVEKPGVAPQAFYSTTIYPTEVRLGGRWVRVARQRMDAVVVIDSAGPPRCTLIRDLRPGDRVVCGVDGVRVTRPMVRRGEDEFAFMSAGVSSERRVELAVDELAWEMQRIRARGGRIVFVAGPVVVHTGGGTHLEKIIAMGYVDALLTGNALPTHDIELNLYGTSLGVDLARGVGVHGGHQHHIKAINRVRAAGSIRDAVEQGIVTAGVMYACVKHGVEYVLAGSIRDDGPLPDTIMDLCEAQAAYTKAIEGADMIVMLSTMLHSIGVGNMTPSGVRLVCVDITPAVVTKLADRGSVESTGIVTDVGLFLNLLARRLGEPIT